MFMNLSTVSLSISDIFGSDFATVISPVLCINFVKLHIYREVILSMT